jgi:hypothetical protein
MTPQRMREIARNYLNHIRDSHIFMEKYAADVEALGEFADQLERNGESISTKSFYTFADPGTEPDGLECVPNWGETPEAAITNVKNDVEFDPADPGYHDSLELYRITIERLPKPPESK